jgi:hypothetical protein
MESFVTLAELEAFWKDVGDTNEKRAEILLKLASNRLRLIGEGSDIDLDAEIAASPVYEANVQWVVMEAVKRAMLTPMDQQPVDTFQQTAGPYSENFKYTNPSGDLWFKKSELAALGLSGNQTLTSISTSRTDIYEWSS